MGKARPVSLHPLSFEEAIKGLIRVDPDKVGLSSKHRSKHKKKTDRKNRAANKAKQNP